MTHSFRLSRRVTAIAVMACAGMLLGPAPGFAEEDVATDYGPALVLPGANVGTDLEPRYNPACGVEVREPRYDVRTGILDAFVTGTCAGPVENIQVLGFIDKQILPAADCQGERCAVTQMDDDQDNNPLRAQARPYVNCDAHPDTDTCRGLFRTRGFVTFTYDHPVAETQLPAESGAWYSCFRDQSNPYVIKCHRKTPRVPIDYDYGGCTHCGEATVPKDPIDVRWVR